MKWKKKEEEKGSDCGVYVVRHAHNGREQSIFCLSSSRPCAKRGATYAWWGARTSNEGPMRVHRLVVG
jgi:hypothetical protein